MNEIKHSHDVCLFRAAISEEKSVTLDFSYLAGTIESWWKKNHDQDRHNFKTQLVTLLLTYLRSVDIFYFDKVGLANGYADNTPMTR